MRYNWLRSLARSRSGQALLESAITVPFLMLIVLNSINIGYYFWAVINLSEATRAGVQWSIMGNGSTLGVAELPPPGDPSLTDVSSVAYLTFQDISGFASRSNSWVGVCMDATPSGGGSVAYSCDNSYGNGSLALTVTPDTDPEGVMTLNRVDIVYKFTPLVGNGWIGVWSPPLQFHRYVEMRALN
jgi:TadE-like protein